MKGLYNDNSDRPFNMAVLFLERLDRRQEECQLAKISGDYFLYFRSLQCIKSMIMFNVIESGDEQEKNKILELFLEAQTHLKNMLITANATNQQAINSYTIGKLNDILDDVYERLNNLIYKYEMLIQITKKRDVNKAFREGRFS